MQIIHDNISNRSGNVPGRSLFTEVDQKNKRNIQTCRFGPMRLKEEMFVDCDWLMVNSL